MRVFIELVDALRCPRAHEETWLVASTTRMQGRDIIEGTLGCPVCLSEYPIRNGVVHFGDPRGAPQAAPPNAEQATRLAAFLDLTDPQGYALLAGAWAGCAATLRDLTSVHLILLNPVPEIIAGNGISVLEVADAVPLADASCRGVALDDEHADAAFSDAAVRVLRPRGRLVAPAATAVPAGAVELARDDQLWVAERDAAPPRLVPLNARRERGDS